MSRPDRRAVLILIALGAAGTLVRFCTGSSGAPGAVDYRAVRAPRSSLDSVAARASRLARPLKRGETVDLDHASPEEITRLPRVGPALAARIVADREASGPFGSLEELDRVSGIGPAVLAAVKPYATFSGRRIDGSSVRRLVDSKDRATPLLGPDRPIHRTADPPNRRGRGGRRSR